MTRTHDLPSMSHTPAPSTSRIVKGLAVALIACVTLAIVVGKRSTDASGKRCSDYQTNNRPCTATEALGFTLTRLLGK
jgi:hypothetical protein